MHCDEPGQSGPNKPERPLPALVFARYPRTKRFWVTRKDSRVWERGGKDFKRINHREQIEIQILEVDAGGRFHESLGLGSTISEALKNMSPME